jgi:serine protease Do
MRFHSASGCLCIIILCLSIAVNCTKPPLSDLPSNPLDKEERSAKIRKSTVRIYVDGKPKGTGFVLAENGLIATAFHVVAKIASTPHKQPHITYASSIKVQFDDGERLPAIVHKSCIGKGLHGSILSDYAILEIKTTKKLHPLRLGTFNDIYEGAHVYLSGHPLVSDRPWISFGIVSAKWKDPVVSYYGQLFREKRNNTEIALLDIPMNRGDSGGPIILIGDTPEEDRVVGIASFIMTPLDQELKALVNAINNYTEGRYDEVCTIELFQLLRKELGCKSLFISGCISIDPLKLRLQQVTKGRQDQRPLKNFIPFL